MSSLVQHPRGDTLAITVPVTGIPDGETISDARIVIGTLPDDALTDQAMTVDGATVGVTVPAATTDGWSLGTYPIEVKVKLSSGQISRVVDTRLKVVASQIGDDVP